jgi:hypothetical protein
VVSGGASSAVRSFEIGDVLKAMTRT